MLAISSAFLDSIICFLMPHFGGAMADASALRPEILATLASYGTRSRAEMINAAQVIALGLTTLDTLAESRTPDMSPSARLRFRGCANNLNRSGQRTETTLVRRLASEVPSPTDLLRAPVNDIPDTEAEAALQQTQAHIEASRRHLSPARPAAMQPTATQPIVTNPTPVQQTVTQPAVTNPIPAHPTATQPAVTAHPAAAPPAALTRAISQAMAAPGPRVIPPALRASTPPANPGPRSDLTSREERNKHLWASAMTQVLSDMGMSPASPFTQAGNPAHDARGQQPVA